MPITKSGKIICGITVKIFTYCLTNQSNTFTVNMCLMNTQVWI